MKTTIFTHVTGKALRGMQNLASFSDAEVYLWPTPYQRSDGKTGWTVAIRRGA